MVGRLPAPQRALEHERELLAEPGLADELGQLPGPERALDLPLVGVRERGDEPVSIAFRHARPSTRSAARSAAAASWLWAVGWLSRPFRSRRMQPPGKGAFRLTGPCVTLSETCSLWGRVKPIRQIPFTVHDGTVISPSGACVRYPRAAAA